MWDLTKGQAYAVLLFSIICEVVGSGCLEACDGFRNVGFSVVTFVCYGIAFYCFSKILHIINLAVGYATWTAVGSITTALMSQFLFHEPISLAGWMAVFGLCIGVVGVNLFGTPKEPSGSDTHGAGDLLVADAAHGAGDLLVDDAAHGAGEELPTGDTQEGGCA